MVARTTLPKTVTDLSKLTVPELWKMFREGMSVTTNGIMMSARAWRELELRGEDLAKYRNESTKHFSAIADGRLHPVVYLRYQTRPPTINMFYGLPLDEQVKRVNIDYRVSVALADGTVKQKSFDDMTYQEMSRVFDGGKIRSVAEQKKLLKPVTVKAYKRQMPKNEVVVQNEDETYELSDLATVSDATGFTWLQLDAEQVKQLTGVAKEHGWSPAQYIVHMLQDQDVIEPKSVKAMSKEAELYSTV